MSVEIVRSGRTARLSLSGSMRSRPRRSGLKRRPRPLLEIAGRVEFRVGEAVVGEEDDSGRPDTSCRLDVVDRLGWGQPVRTDAGPDRPAVRRRPRRGDLIGEAG